MHADYGTHLGGDQVAPYPWREDAKRHEGPNFYFGQVSLPYPIHPLMTGSSSEGTGRPAARSGEEEQLALDHYKAKLHHRRFQGEYGPFHLAPPQVKLASVPELSTREISCR